MTEQIWPASEGDAVTGAIVWKTRKGYDWKSILRFGNTKRINKSPLLLNRPRTDDLAAQAIPTPLAKKKVSTRVPKEKDPAVNEMSNFY